MSSQPVRRPFSVTVVVVLVWIYAILTIIGGLLLFFNANNEQLLLDAQTTSGTVRLTALVGILLGLIVAVVASSLGGGSRFARFLITLVLILRILYDIYLLAAWGGEFLGATIISVIILLLILFLLWNSKASRFFNPM
ncbi:MAG: hypothetical protein KDC39_00980 [Actinobacteria bacterium]|nr:hypothetical protein [Actinomycetota bacterium]